MQLLRPFLLAALLAAAACAPRTPPQLLSPDPGMGPSAPSAVPLPLPTYPYEPGFWV
jgi:hypothetical protein